MNGKYKMNNFGLKNKGSYAQPCLKRARLLDI